MNLFKKLISSVCAFAMLASMAVAVQAAESVNDPIIADTSKPVITAKIADGYDEETGKGVLEIYVSNLETFFGSLPSTYGNSYTLASYGVSVSLPDTMFDVTALGAAYLNNVRPGDAAANYKPNTKKTYGGTFAPGRWTANTSVGIGAGLTTSAYGMTDLEIIDDQQKLFTVNFQVSEEALKDGFDAYTIGIVKSEMGYEIADSVTWETTCTGLLTQGNALVVDNKATIPAQQGTGGGEGGEPEPEYKLANGTTEADYNTNEKAAWAVKAFGAGTYTGFNWTVTWDNMGTEPATKFVECATIESAGDLNIGLIITYDATQYQNVQITAAEAVTQ